MENLIFSVNVVAPLFVLVALGYFLKRAGVTDQRFVDMASNVVFKAALPVLLFKNIYDADMSQVFSLKLILFSVVAILAVAGLSFALVPLFVRDNPRRGAIIQAIFRSNYAIIGMPLAINMFGQTGAGPAALLMPFSIPVFNILAVVTLTVFAPHDGEKRKINVGRLLLNIVTNPLIIGVVLALPFSIFGWQLPYVAEKSISDVSALATPLALLTLGCQFDFKSAWGNIRASGITTFVRLVAVPVAVVGAAAAMGFRGYQLGAVYILFSSPAAVSSFVMAKSMKSDAELAGQMVLLTTFFSAFTVFLGVFALKSLGWI